MQKASFTGILVFFRPVVYLSLVNLEGKQDYLPTYVIS